MPNFKWSSKGPGALSAGIPGRKFRVAAFAAVVGLCAAAFVLGGPSKPVLIAIVLCSPAVALIAPEIVELWCWYIGKAEEHAVDREERIYRFGYTDIRMLMGEDSRPWFAADDICAALGFSHVERELQRLKTGRCMRLGSGDDKYLSEAGVTDLIDRSGNPETRKFRIWFTREVMFPFTRAREKEQEHKAGR